MPIDSKLFKITSYYKMDLVTVCSYLLMIISGKQERFFVRFDFTFLENAEKTSFFQRFKQSFKLKLLSFWVLNKVLNRFCLKLDILHMIL